MSERPREQPPPDTSNPAGNYPSQPRNPPNPPPPGYYAPTSTAGSSGFDSPTFQAGRQPSGNARALELPPLPPQAMTTSTRSFSPASRSILNPADPDDYFQGRRRKASQLDSPSASSMPFLPPLATTSHAPPGFSGAHVPAPTSALSAFGEGPPRRILTPRSPSLHRAASLNQLNPPSATLNVQQTPFPVSPGSRSYAIEPGSSGIPPLPTPPAGLRQSYGLSAPTPPVQTSRRASVGASRGRRQASESASPRSSYSPYSQASPPPYGASSMPTLSAPYSSHHDPSIGGSGNAGDRRAVGVPISSSGGPNVYQMMTLETTSGTVQLPVDVQAASRVADEKRRRNAGASARFRQRRKEKEKEASTTISKLEQQVKELGEDMDFYKRERDYFAGVVLQVPGGDRHFPRPQSPRHRRRASLTGHSVGSGAGYAPIQEQGARSPDEGRNVRRRTSTISLPPPTQVNTPLAMPGQAFNPSYSSQGYGQSLAPQQHPSGPPPQPPPPMHPGGTHLPSPLGRGLLPALAPPGPHQLMQAPPNTGPWNPYAERRPTGGPGQGRENR